MLMRGVVVALLAMLAGCVTSKEIYLPDGAKGHNISCDSIFTSTDGCFQKAGEICGSKGYTIANIPAGMMSARGLFIKCKE
jgi:hypothetical protein